MRHAILISLALLVGCNGRVTVEPRGTGGSTGGEGGSPTTVTTTVTTTPEESSSAGGTIGSGGTGGTSSAGGSSTGTSGGTGGAGGEGGTSRGTSGAGGAGGAGGQGGTGGSTSPPCGPIFMETFADNSAGWTLDAEWEIGPATVSSGQGWNNPDPGVDTTPTDDNGVAGVVIGGNGSTIVHPFRWLTSPDIPIDPAFGAVHVAWQRWLNTDYLPLALNRVDVWGVAQPDGALGWVSIWESGAFPGPADDAWTMQSFDVTTIAAAGVIRVRFGAAVLASGAFKTSGWNVDDVTVFAPCE